MRILRAVLLHLRAAVVVLVAVVVAAHNHHHRLLFYFPIAVPLTSKFKVVIG